MGEMALRVAAEVGYSSAGTVEFLLTADGEVFFLEMNTRIQVEHPITERVTGVDLIREMVVAAAGEPICLTESVVDIPGHAVEVRVNAEDPSAGFRPTPGPIRRFRMPGGTGIRVDSGVEAGSVIPGDYDSLIAKVISWAPDRQMARVRMLRALDEFLVEGPSTTIPFARAVLRHPRFIRGEAGTTFVSDHLEELVEAMGPFRPPAGEPANETSQAEAREFQLEVNRKLFHVRVFEPEAEQPARLRPRPRRHTAVAPSTGDVVSPMHGTVVKIGKEPGEPIQEGETLFIVEAMKMENEIPAGRSGTVTDILTSVGDTVEEGQVLARVE
jgi:acetyl-CoA/propionyl-CoA carboxylase biotin carboxyl carrier protein